MKVTEFTKVDVSHRSQNSENNLKGKLMIFKIMDLVNNSLNLISGFVDWLDKNQNELQDIYSEPETQETGLEFLDFALEVFYETQP